MKKSKLTDGRNVFVVTMRHHVTSSMFVMALTNHFYDEISGELEELLRGGQISRGNLFIDPVDEDIINFVVSKNPFTKMTKTEGKNILYDSLTFYGIQGSFQDGYFEASYERGLAYEHCNKYAKIWVSKNYPYLTEK
jgi:hypothetical protein